MDQYLKWDSHHHLSAKYTAINTLTHREKQFVINLNYSKKKWSISGKYSLTHPKWALGRVEKRLTKPTSEVSNGAKSQGTAGAQPTTIEAKTKSHIVTPYTQGLCKSIKKVCSK